MKQGSTPRPMGQLPAWWGIVLVGFLLFGFKIGMPLTDGDTAFYARIAQNIIESGEWQTLRFKDYALIDKPPLTIWLIAASYLVFGINEVAIRGWHILMSIGTVFIVYKTALLFYSHRKAALSGWILLSSALFVYCGIVPQQDMPLTFFLALGLYGFARFLRGDGWAHTYTLWIATALGVLARGVQSFVLPVAIAGAVLLFLGRKRWTQILKPWPKAVLHLGAGLLLCVLIAAPWFILEYREHGEIFFDTFFGAGNSRFFTGADEGLDLVRNFAYVPLLFVSFLPWSGLIGHAVWTAGRRVLRRSGEEASLRSEDEDARLKLGDTLFLVWFLAAFAMPWLIHWRVIRYLLPAIPPLAVLAARYLAPYLEGPAEGKESSGGIRVAGILGIIIVLPILILTIAVLARALPPDQLEYAPMVLPLLLALAASMLLFGGAGWVRRYRLAVYGLIAGGILTFAILLSGLHTFMVDVNPWKEAAAIVNNGAAVGDRVVWAGGGDNWFLDFYVGRTVDRAQAVTDDPEAFAGSWLIGTPAGLEKLSGTADIDVDEVWQRGDVRVVRVR